VPTPSALSACAKADHAIAHDETPWPPLHTLL
jgi:hypothetical protein